jgi:predicted TIM-barrel fold metal-dependent hydrolase
LPSNEYPTTELNQDDALRIVSVDDHIIEPPHVWSDRLPTKYRDIGPRLVRERALAKPEQTAAGRQRNILDIRADDPWVWCDAWHYEDQLEPLTRATASAGFDPSETEMVPVTYDEIRPGCFNAKERLLDMDIDGVEASLCFPNVFVRFCGQRFINAKDKDLALLCVKAYNDFLAEEWVGPSEGRLLGAAILPLWDVQLSVAEIERNASRGCRAVCFSEIPAWLGLPSMYSGEWDPLFAACERTGVVICIHVGSSSTFTTTSADAPRSAGVITFSNNTALSFTDWIMSGTLIRFPYLRIAFSEGQAGWIPYVLNRMEVMWREGKAYNMVAKLLPELPRTYLKNMYFCIFDDEVGIQNLDLIGEDNVCFETDYPHPDGSFPHSRRIAAANTSSLDPVRQEKVLRTNAIRLFGLEI